MRKSNDLSQRIWSGDVSVVAESEDRFIEHPERMLVSHACVLYNFRNHGTNAQDLKDLRDRLLAQAADDLARKEPRTEEEREKFANRLEAMAAIMLWISRQGDVPEIERQDLRKSVFNLCVACIELTTLHEDRHAYSLVRITYAQLALDDEEESWARHYMEMAAHTAHGIRDPNQRNRAYRGLSSLYWRLGQRRLSFYWGIRACFQRHIPWAVRKKSIDALFSLE